jgi:hypothetical protein
MKNVKKPFLLLAVGIFASIGVANASLLATDWTASSSLYSLNTTTGVATLIGSTGQTQMIGLVVDTNSTIYAISEEANSRLWTLNPTTGLATLVGSTGFNLQEGDMTIDPVSGAMYVADGAGDKLYTINKATGATTLVGSFGALGRDVSGLQFLNGNLYGLALREPGPAELLQINPATAAVTNIGSTGVSFGVIAAMGRDPATNLVYVGGPTTNFGSDNELYTINLATGATTLVGPISGIQGSLSGFSVSGSPTILNPTPEPATLGLTGLALCGLAVFHRRGLQAILRRRTS